MIDDCDGILFKKVRKNINVDLIDETDVQKVLINYKK